MPTGRQTSRARKRPTPKKVLVRDPVSRQKGTVSQRRPKAELQHLNWKGVELERLNPLISRRFIAGRDVMVSRVLLKKGAVVPMHSHANEQLTYILEGALKFWIDGKEILVRAGEVLAIPANMPHKAKAMLDTVDLDVFSPPRADWINKDDRYLRGGRA